MYAEYLAQVCTITERMVSRTIVVVMLKAGRATSVSTLNETDTYCRKLYLFKCLKSFKEHDGIGMNIKGLLTM
jgi:hypothetical protein